MIFAILFLAVGKEVVAAEAPVQSDIKALAAITKGQGLYYDVSGTKFGLRPVAAGELPNGWASQAYAADDLVELIEEEILNDVSSHGAGWSLGATAYWDLQNRRFTSSSTEGKECGEVTSAGWTLALGSTPSDWNWN